MALGVLTLGQIRTSAQQRANMENSNFLTTSEWNFNINQSYYELYDLLVQKYGDDYYVNEPPYAFSTDGQTYLYPLPNNFYKLLGVDLSLSPSSQDSWVTIRPFMFADRNRYAVPNFQSFYGLTNLRYRIQANFLWLTPIPAAGQNMRIWYIPRMVELVSDSDTADGVSGWDEYIIVDAAIKALVKEESDPTALLQAKLGLIQRIESAAENRDAANPQVISDTQWSDYGIPGGNGSGEGGFF